MKRIVLAAVLCAAAFAQAPAPSSVEDKAPAPAKVDQALRARIEEFYTLLMNQDYRKVEALVADDTKDLYYKSNKPVIDKYKLLSIKYSGKYTHATVITECAQKVATPGFPMGEWNLKVVSNWKLVKKQWYWYLDQTSETNPVGLTKKVTPADPNAPKTAPEASIPKEINMSPDVAMGKLSADKKELTITPGGSDTVTLTNGSQGYVKFMLGAVPAGLDVSFDKSELTSGQKAVLTVKGGKDVSGGSLYVILIPTNEIVEFHVSVKKDDK